MTHLIAAFFGASGQGKTSLAKELIAARAPERLLVFDPMNEYSDVAERAPDLRSMLAATRAARGFRLRYVPPRGTANDLAARFDGLCALAYDAGDLLLVVEELQLVTRPSWAPPAWSECTLRGRHKGVSIAGLSQRPASVDKNFLSNCSALMCCRLNFDDDVSCLSRMLGVERDRIAALPRFRYIGRDMNTGAVHEGKTRAPGAAAARAGKKKYLRRRLAIEGCL